MLALRRMGHERLAHARVLVSDVDAGGGGDGEAWELGIGRGWRPAHVEEPSWRVRGRRPELVGELRPQPGKEEGRRRGARDDAMVAMAGRRALRPEGEDDLGAMLANEGDD